MTPQPRQLSDEESKILCNAFTAKMDAFYHLAQHVATLASGTLAATVTFISIENKGPLAIWTLKCGWVCLVLAVVGFVLVHLARVDSYDTVIDDIQQGRGLRSAVSPRLGFHIGRLMLVYAFPCGLALIAAYGFFR